MAGSLPPGTGGACGDASAQVYGWPGEVSIIHKTCRRARAELILQKKQGGTATTSLVFAHQQITTPLASEGPAAATATAAAAATTTQPNTVTLAPPPHGPGDGEKGRAGEERGEERRGKGKGRPRVQQWSPNTPVTLVKVCYGDTEQETGGGGEGRGAEGGQVQVVWG